MNIFKRGAAEPQADEMEGEIREFVRRDVAGQRVSEGEVVAQNMGTLLQRVSVSSVQEIDRIIDELNILKQRLLQDSERVQREITEYATLSQAAMQSTRIIAESLGHFRKSSDTALRKMPEPPPVSEGE